MINEYVTEYSAFVNEDRLGNIPIGGSYPLYYFCDVTEYNIKNIDYAGFITVGEISSAGVEKSQFGDTIFYSALGERYVARISDDKSVSEIRKFLAKEITIDDLKKISVGMDVFELVEAAGLPSRSTFALMSYVPIFEAGDGSYAVVQLNEDSLVETVKIRTADELIRDLREGMGEEDIPQDVSVIRCGKYALYEANGRWCIALIEESVISKVKYYESYDWENESFDKVLSIDLFGYVRNFGIPRVVTDQGQELLMFEKSDGTQMVLQLNDDGETVKSRPISVN